MAGTTTLAGRDQHKNGLRLLSLDAGGPRNISQLEILRHVMERACLDDSSPSNDVIKPPCDLFDVIGGVGTGGFIAILLVVLKLTAKEALEDFIDFSVKVFKDIDPDPMKQTSKLEQATQGILDKYGVDKNRKLIQDGEPTPKCKLVIPITYKNHVGSICVLSNSSSRREPSTNLTVFEAMLASCATSPIFTPVTISKDYGTFDYVSGDLGLNNPVREVLAGAHRTFGDEATVSCLLSIGCGNLGVTRAPIDSGLDSRVAFLERVAMDSERAAEEINTQMAQLTLYHRISVKYGLEVDVSSAWRNPHEITTQTSTYLNDLEVGDTISHCVESLNEGSGFTTLEQLRHSGGAKVIAAPLPPLAPNYVEREFPTKFLEVVLFEAEGMIKGGSKIVTVTGIGGCGKTQLIRRFLEKHGSFFASMSFVDGSSRDSIKHDIVRHVRSFGSVHSQDSFKDAMRFLSHPTANSERILIIDNVDDPLLDLSPFLPRWSKGTVLVTSRNQSRGQLSPNSHLQLDVMSPEESVQLLTQGFGNAIPLSESNRMATVMVAEELGFLPIALVQAVSYIFNTGCTEATYVTQLRKNKARVLRNPATNQLDMRYKTAFAAFDASYDLLLPSAQKILHLLSFFHREGFPIDFINIAAKDDFSVEHDRLLARSDAFKRGRDCLRLIFYPSGEWDSIELDLAIASLRDHSLVNVVFGVETRLLHMHPLVHEWGRLRLLKDDLQRFEDAAIRLLCCGAIDDNYLMMRYLCVHVRALSSAYEMLHANDAASFGFILYESSLYYDASGLQKLSYDLVHDQLGAGHPNTVHAAATLAETYRQLGRYEKAMDMQLEVLEKRTGLLGLEHPSTVDASASLAATYRRLGDYVKAGRLEEEVLRRRTMALGPNHRRTIDASENLAASYRRLERHHEAKQLQEEVLRQRISLLGVDHPSTLDAAAELAVTYRELGRHAKAEQLQVEVLKRRTELLGIDHISTVNATTNLALTYYELERYAEAERLETEVLKQRIKLQGLDHPSTVRAFKNLETTLLVMGKVTEAERLLTELEFGR